MTAKGQSSRLLGSLSPDERARIAPFLDEVILGRGQVLQEANEPIAMVYFPHDCVTSTIIDTPEGRAIEVGLSGLEGIVGFSLLLGGVSNNTTVVVQIPGRAARMRASDFIEHIAAPRGETYTALLRFTDAFFSMVAQTAACNSLHNLNQRLARWILMTQDRVGHDRLPLTQEFIAYMLGVRRATVSAAASQLQERGLIRYVRGEISVIDREGLERTSCTCYDIVRGITNRLYAAPIASQNVS